MQVWNNFYANWSRFEWTIFNVSSLHPSALAAHSVQQYYYLNFIFQVYNKIPWWPCPSKSKPAPKSMSVPKLMCKLEHFIISHYWSLARPNQAHVVWNQSCIDEYLIKKPQLLRFINHQFRIHNFHFAVIDRSQQCFIHHLHHHHHSIKIDQQTARQRGGKKAKQLPPLTDVPTSCVGRRWLPIPPPLCVTNSPELLIPFVFIIHHIWPPTVRVSFSPIVSNVINRIFGNKRDYTNQRDTTGLLKTKKADNNHN